MLIAGGRVVDPVQRIDALRDLRIENGVVVEIGERIAPHAGEEVVDASGAYVSPGFIDMHVHLRIPGNPEKETLETGSAAAAAGGFTAVAAMPNTNPAIDTPALVRASRHAEPCRIYPIAAITKGRGGIEPVDFDALENAGAVAFSDDGSTIANAEAEVEAAAASGAERLFITHCEDEHLKAAGFTDIAESAIVARDVSIAVRFAKRWHIAHVSAALSLDVIRAARQCEGARLTCEVTPHHLTLTKTYLQEHGPRGKVNPPLQSEQDARAMRDGVRDGTIDAFATDHAPHTEEEKTRPVEDACVGFTGLEVAAGAYAYALPDLPVSRFVELISSNPARILKIPGGSLACGSAADVTIFADREWVVDPATFRSKGRSTPFAGTTLPRRVLKTFVGGVCVFR